MSKTALVSSIQHFSTDDGAGIRTTVFLQGCNLCCPWCHNPETRGSPVMLISRSCTLCGLCASVCKSGAHTVNVSGHSHDINKCISCGMCENICPNHALFLSGKCMTLESVVKEIKEDVPFYRSGGGVTFSGGEPLLQYLFCAEAARECKKSGIGVIIDTAGNVPFDRFSELIPYTDEFYYDVKATEQRSAEINCDYSLISANLILLSETARVTVRVPIIPGFNDNADFIDSLAVLLKKHR